MKVFSLIGECAEKSELVRRLVAEFVARDVRVSVIKRVSDAVDLERPGSGTWKHREAGAAEVMIASATRFALLHEFRNDAPEPDVSTLVGRLVPVDLVLLDGFRRSAMPKMEVVPTEQRLPRYAELDPLVLALASDLAIPGPRPCLPLSDIAGLADFVFTNAVASYQRS